MEHSIDVSGLLCEKNWDFFNIENPAVYLIVFKALLICQSLIQQLNNSTRLIEEILKNSFSKGSLNSYLHLRQQDDQLCISEN